MQQAAQNLTMQPQRAKSLEVVAVKPPPKEQRVARDARIPKEGEKPNRYSLPRKLQSGSPVGYRTRISLSTQEAETALGLLSLAHPEHFVPDADPVLEEELFEESSLGILSSRQSTNFRGHKQVSLGAEDSQKVAGILRGMQGLDGVVHDNATHTHIVLSRPYRTPFTMLLTLIGHKPILSLVTVGLRAFRKRFMRTTDIPTISYLEDLHLGVLADSMERAAVVASQGRRAAQVLREPFSKTHRRGNAKAIRELERLCGLTNADRRAGFRVSMVAQVGQVSADHQLHMPLPLWRKLGANLLAFRSQRVQPGVNPSDNAPAPYQSRQDMDVSDKFTEMAGRAAYNAFSHWTGLEREQAKKLLLLDRIDVLTPNGKERLRAVRQELNDITDQLIRDLPLWADLPAAKAFSRNAEKGRKAFSLVGQRIYIGGLSREEIEDTGLPWDVAVFAVGAAAARSSLYAELMGCVELPDGCDLLAGMCLMAGPVNQNDIGKTYYGYRDLLDPQFGHRQPTSLLVWSLKAKTVADPIGNEEQLLSAHRKGALVDLRASPHEIVSVRSQGRVRPFRQQEGHTNQERAFYEQGNFVTAPDSTAIEGNAGEAWPAPWRKQPVWTKAE